MKPSQRKPLLFTRDFDDVTYRCDKCAAIEKRVVERDRPPPR
jgi:hypothetical protein